jgi:hypothetical protein
MVTTCEDEHFHGGEGDILRSMGYSRCLCLGLASIDLPNWVHPATAQHTTRSAKPRVLFALSNFFAELLDKFLRR